MFLSPSKCNVYRTHDPAYYGRLPRHITPGKGICADGDRQSSFNLRTLHRKQMFNSTAREDTSPVLSCGLSCIAESERASGAETIHPAVTALKATGTNQWESPVKIFAMMKAKVSNQTTPLKNTVVYEDLTPAHRILRDDMKLEKMDVEQYPSSVDDTDAFILSPPNSPDGSPTSEMNSDDPDVRFYGGHNKVRVFDPSVPAEGIRPAGASTEPEVATAITDPTHVVGNSGTTPHGCRVLVERLPVIQSPAKIFALMKKEERRPLKQDLLNQTSENKGNVQAITPFMDMPLDDTHHVYNSVGAACSDSACVPAQQQSLEDSMLLRSPRLTIPQKQKVDFDCKVGRIEGIHLKDWVLRLSDSKLFVDGKRVDTKIPWHSNTIVQRIANNVLKTVSGSTYILVGKMATQFTSELPKWFLKKFLFGFPQMWEMYLQMYLTKNKGVKETKHLETFVPSKLRKPSQKETKPEKLVIFNSTSPPGSSQGDSLKVSRSGRRIKTPLEYWKGGRVIVDKDLNVTVLEDYSIVQTPTSRVAQEKPQNKQSTTTQKETYPNVSRQDEAGAGLVRKAKPYQWPRCCPTRDNAPSQEREQKLPRRASRRSASASPSANQEKEQKLPRKPSARCASATTPANQKKEQMPPRRTSRRSASASPPDNQEKEQKLPRKPSGRCAGATTPANQEKEQMPPRKTSRTSASASSPANHEKKPRPPRKTSRRSASASPPANHEKKPRPPRKTSRRSASASPPDNQEKKQRPPRRTSRRSASASLPDNEDQTNTDAPVFQKEGEGQVNAYGRRLLQHRLPPWLDTNQSVRQSSWNSSEGLSPLLPRRPRPQRQAPVDAGLSSNTKSKNTKTTPEPPTPAGSQSPSDTEQQMMGPPMPRTRRGGRKNKLLSKDDDVADVFSEDFISERDSTSKRRKPKGKKGSPKETTEDVNDGKWTDQELQNLYNAINCLPKYTPTFWENVALEVGTRSLEECQEQYSAQQKNGHARPRARQKKKPQTNEEAVKEMPQITAKAGTLRRKQQIREVLDHLPKDDHDDVFTSSPMQKKLKKLPTFSDGGDGDPLGQLVNPQTPSSSMFAGVKTPKCLHISPGMFPSINRNDNDKYVFHFQNKMKRRKARATKDSTKTGKNNHTPSPSVKRTDKARVAEDDSFVVWKMFSQKEAPSLSNDESEDDYYFSDA